jgi:hypothetical protein
MSAIGKREEVIEQWMLAIVSDGGVRRFDDLHIDQVDPEWTQRSQWIAGGLEALRIAIDIRNRNQLPFAVGLGFSLESGDHPRGVDFRTKEEFCERLDWSPPSLYLFHRGEEPHTETTHAAVHHLDPAILGAEGNLHCYYLEFRQQDSADYYRSIFVEG